MKILGIDYGERKIGLAIAENLIAEPFQVLRYESHDWMFKKLLGVVKKQKIERIVVGVSESRSRRKAKLFGESLGKLVTIPVLYSDETLTTKEAQRLSLEANIKRSKRRKLEDAYASAVMLQLYLENHV